MSAHTGAMFAATALAAAGAKRGVALAGSTSACAAGGIFAAVGVLVAARKAPALTGCTAPDMRHPAWAG